jgi:hypothetical protein
MSKTYTNKSNANRAGKKQYGAGKFVIAGSGKSFTVGPKAKRNRSNTADKAPLAGQPQMQTLIKAIRSHDGCTVSDGVKALGGVSRHTVRGAVSRLIEEGLKVTKAKQGRYVVYHAK